MSTKTSLLTNIFDGVKFNESIMEQGEMTKDLMALAISLNNIEYTAADGTLKKYAITLNDNAGVLYACLSELPDEIFLEVVTDVMKNDLHMRKDIEEDDMGYPEIGSTAFQRYIDSREGRSESSVSNSSSSVSQADDHAPPIQSLGLSSVTNERVMPVMYPPGMENDSSQGYNPYPDQGTDAYPGRPTAGGGGTGLGGVWDFLKDLYSFNNEDGIVKKTNDIAKLIGRIILIVVVPLVAISVFIYFVIGTQDKDAMVGNFMNTVKEILTTIFTS